MQAARQYFEKPKMQVYQVPKISFLQINDVARKLGITITIYEPELQEDEAIIWYLKNCFKYGDENCIIGIQRAHCFYIRDLEAASGSLGCKDCGRQFTERRYLRNHRKTDCSPETQVVCKGERINIIPNESDSVFFSKFGQFSFKACRWIEGIADEHNVHIHYAMCGHGGEREVGVLFEGDEKKKKVKVDGYEPISKTVFEFHGCRYHGCPCYPERDVAEYGKTIIRDQAIRDAVYGLVTMWECNFVDRAVFA